jgi:hypothetical protein
MVICWVSQHKHMLKLIFSCLHIHTNICNVSHKQVYTFLVKLHFMLTYIHFTSSSLPWNDIFKIFYKERLISYFLQYTWRSEMHLCWAGFVLASIYTHLTSLLGMAFWFRLCTYNSVCEMISSHMPACGGYRFCSHFCPYIIGYPLAPSSQNWRQIFFITLLPCNIWTFTTAKANKQKRCFFHHYRDILWKG